MRQDKWQILISFLRQHILLLFAVFTTGTVYNIVTLLIPIAIGKFFELNFDLSSKKLRILESFNLLTDKDFGHFIVIFTCLIFLRFVFEYFNRFLIGLMGERFSKDLREQLFGHQLHISYPVYEEQGIGKYLLRFSGDLKGVQNYLTRGILRFSQDMLLIVILMAVIFAVSPVFATAIIVFSIIPVLLLHYFNKILYTISVERRNLRSGLLSFVNTRLRAISSVKIFNKYSTEHKRYKKRSGHLYKTGIKYQHIVSLIYSMVPALTYLLIAFLMAIIYYYFHGDDQPVSLSTLLILVLIIISILPVIRRILRISVVWKLGNISFSKLIRILELEKENTKEAAAGEQDSILPIQFQDVRFVFKDSDTPIFENLNITFIHNNLYQITGPTGSGKTTLIKLLLSIYKPTEGVIDYKGRSHDEMNELDIRRQIAVVSDMVPLYGKDVYEAIVYSRNEIRRQRAEKLLHELQQHEPEHLKLMLSDKIGDLGSNLSTGQKKIAMYARALMTNKPVLIIENPLEGLGQNTSGLIYEKIMEFSRKKDRAVIALSNDYLDAFKESITLKIKDKKINPVAWSRR